MDQISLIEGLSEILDSSSGNSDKEKDKLKLIPIDHGLSIPDTLDICSYDLVWLSYNQAE